MEYAYRENDGKNTLEGEVVLTGYRNPLSMETPIAHDDDAFSFLGGISLEEYFSTLFTCKRRPHFNVHIEWVVFDGGYKLLDAKRVGVVGENNGAWSAWDFRRIKVRLWVRWSIHSRRGVGGVSVMFEERWCGSTGCERIRQISKRKAGFCRVTDNVRIRRSRAWIA